MRYAKVPIGLIGISRSDGEATWFANVRVTSNGYAGGPNEDTAVKNLLNSLYATEIPADYDDRLAKAESEIARLRSVLALVPEIVSMAEDIGYNEGYLQYVDLPDEVKEKPRQVLVKERERCTVLLAKVNEVLSEV